MAVADAGRRRRWRSRSRLGLVVAALASLALAGCAGALSQPADNITNTGATLHGIVFDPVSETVTYWFRYGPTSSFGTHTTHRTIAINDQDNHPVSEPVTGLDPATLYHYELCSQSPGNDPVCGGERTFTTGGSVAKLAITAQPGLTPAFDPTVSDYVTRCAGGPVTVTVAAPPDTEVAVDGDTAHTGRFTQDVPLDTGRAFTFTTTTGGQTRTFHVRCLPSDFPAWTYTRQGTPKASFYITTPQQSITPSGQSASTYVAIFDDDGVPVWWYRAPAADAKLLPDGTLGWWTGTAAGTSNPGFEVHALDGRLLHTWRTVGSKTDIHDFQLLPNGDALMQTYPPRPGTVDLSAYGGPSENATISEPEIQEIDPQGNLVWSWNADDHGIGPADTGTRWWPFIFPFPGTTADGRKIYDYAHINSIQQVGNTIVASFRHLDAVYAIQKSTGNIIWKLGGKPAPQSLTVRDDPQGGYPLGGQHFARVLPDGTITIHDNNTFLSDPPRAVRYRIDAVDKTATLVEQVTDPDVPSSPCCGSAQRLDDGSWLMSWGGVPVVTEFGPAGGRHFELTFAQRTGTNAFSYRVDPITGSSPSLSDLRAGMDAMPATAGTSASRAVAPVAEPGADG